MLKKLTGRQILIVLGIVGTFLVVISITAPGSLPAILDFFAGLFSAAPPAGGTQ